MDEIEQWRIRIDELDEKLIELFNKRAVFANEIGRVKKKHGIPVYNPERENLIYEHVQRINPGPLPDSAIRRLFERIIDETRRLERETSEKGDTDGH